MLGPSIKPGYSQPNIRLACTCGWEGHDDDITDWDVQIGRDRVVRICPSCGEPVPEWGTLTPIEGAAQLARGPLEQSLADAG